MTFIQIICIQLLVIVVSHQILANPIIGEESSDGMIDNNRNLVQNHDYIYNDNFEKILNDLYNHDHLQHFYDKISKRRAQAKANLAGLWGVPTRFA
ncbi:unnamed protein product [Rotaria sp. Silwood1]|nr:unnamed protein product [Rotaria sp. Silwood1]CAF1161331.1 unnamed protein product [Rotaria sp. Silwood1]CAF1165808.1 unnamed protein product [Rotaria sp. Silwood1]CAF3458192.1 unnamed protein product [Rotaria sp. Silwood1]CAF3478377.1 unnamed protein product [Rotaria sp. Silwood1]